MPPAETSTCCAEANTGRSNRSAVSAGRRTLEAGRGGICGKTFMSGESSWIDFGGLKWVALVVSEPDFIFLAVDSPAARNLKSGRWEFEELIQWLARTDLPNPIPSDQRKKVGGTFVPPTPEKPTMGRSPRPSG